MRSEYFSNFHMPLVSVVVVTYNSVSTVVDTLNSIKNQTYFCLELIVSDDNSTDNTVLVCKKWLEENKSRFEHCEVITSEKNTGVSCNLNRGIKRSCGEWVKCIAGDDIMMEECISLNINYVMKNKEVGMLFSRMSFLGDMESIARIKNKFSYGFFYLTPRQQYLRLLILNTVPAPTSFMKKSVIESLEYYDESIRLIEDWPFWLKALSNHYELAFLNEETVIYRVGSSMTTSHSLSHSYLETRKLMEEKLDFYRNLENSTYRRYIKLWKNYKKEPSFFHTIAVLTNPYTWYCKYIFLKEKYYNLKYGGFIKNK